MFLALCLAVLPQTQPEPTGADWYTLHPASPQQQAAGSRVTVSARQSAVGVEPALRSLARTLGWVYREPSASVRAQMAPIEVDLAFSRQPPRQVAELLAAAAGLGVEFDGDQAGRSLRLIEDPADPAEQRRRAAGWYRRVLALDRSQVSRRTRTEAQLGLGRVLQASGDLDAAIECYDAVFETDEGWDLARLALRYKSQAHSLLARLPGQPEARQRAEQQLACDTARRLWRNRTPADTGAAALRLAEALAQGGRHQECVDLLTADHRAWLAQPESAAIQLRIVASLKALGDTDRALRYLDVLARRWREDPVGTRMTPGRWRRFHLLRGTALELRSRSSTVPESARLEAAQAAMASLEDHLALAASADPVPQADAWLALGRVYLATGRHLQAIAALRRILRRAEELDPGQLHAARELEARTQAACGARVEAPATVEEAAPGSDR